MKKKNLPLKCMDSWERFHKAFLPDKKVFCSEMLIIDMQKSV